MKNAEVIKRFLRGETTSTASRMKIEAVEDGTILVGYGWAVYAHRSSDGEILVFDDWEGYSSTTTKHIRHFKPDEAHYAPEEVKQYDIEFSTGRPEFNQ
ncbi:MAG: hypothetical protein ABEH81_01425 [Halopenitus sp.]